LGLCPKKGLEATQVTEKGIARIERHLNNTPGIKPGEKELKMVERLKAGERTDFDLKFYQHELRESRNIKTMRNVYGDTQKAAIEAHNKTSLQYGMDPFETVDEVIHPDVLAHYDNW
jgi:hypothetical protein